MRLILATLLTLAFAPLHARELSRAEILGVLEGVAEARGKDGFSARFRETKILPLLKEPVTETGTLSFLPPGRFRKETTGPRPTLTVFNGETLWIVFPADQFAETYELESNRMLRESFTSFLSVLEVSKAETSFNVSGEEHRDGYHLVLVPRNRRLRNVISKAEVRILPDHKISSVTLHEPGGGRSHIELFDQHKEDFSPGDFHYSPPPSMTVSSPLAR